MHQTANCECRSIFLTVLVDLPREAWKRLINRLRGVRDIGPHDAHLLIAKGAFVLDVREQHEYAAGHVPDSTLIPLATLIGRLDALAPLRERDIVVICHGGKRSATACWQLRQHGYKRTFNIAGGILGWKKSGLPVEK